jgi:hypothetical protein
MESKASTLALAKRATTNSPHSAPVMAKPLRRTTCATLPAEKPLVGRAPFLVVITGLLRHSSL